MILEPIVEEFDSISYRCYGLEVIDVPSRSADLLSSATVAMARLGVFERVNSLTHEKEAHLQHSVGKSRSGDR